MARGVTIEHVSFGFGKTPVLADISKVEAGQRLTVGWRGQPVWIIKARTWGGGMASPVVYGHVTLSMRQTAGPEPLVVGRTYRVSVLNASRVEMGSRIFGP